MKRDETTTAKPQKQQKAPFYKLRLHVYRHVIIQITARRYTHPMNGTKQIARERIHILFNLARRTIQEDPEQAQRYVTIARRISMTTKVRLPKEYRQQVCRHCKRFILLGVNSRVRIQQRREPHVVITCLLCGESTRIPLKERRKYRHAYSRNETQNKA